MSKKLRGKPKARKNWGNVDPATKVHKSKKARMLERLAREEADQDFLDA